MATQADTPTKADYKRAVEAVLDCDTDTDEEGNQYIKVPARSIFDLGAQLSALIEADTK